MIFTIGYSASQCWQFNIIAISGGFDSSW
ncbi:MAG: hypothetical protein ACD_84C00039G0001, partial [uncultured bacterium]